MQVSRVKGVEKLLNQMKAHVKSKEKKFEAAMTTSAAMLLRWSLPYVPVQFGVLRSTGEVRVYGHGFHTDAHTGYGTNYAAFVHEMEHNAHGQMFNVKWAEKIARISKWRKKHKLGPHVYWFNRGPKQRSKFLRFPFRMHLTELKKNIERRMK